MFQKISNILFLSLTAFVGFSGCKKIYDVPEERDYLSPRAGFTRKEFGGENDFVLGRTSMSQSTEFNADFSTFPLKFEIRNVRLGNGKPTNDILKVKPVLVWTQPYTGFEKTLAEIDAKRKVEQHPIFEIRPSGQFILWSSSRAADLESVTDSDYVTPQERRFFDVKLSNSGGERIIRDFQLNVYRERPYEPSKDLEPLTGKLTGTFNHPVVSNVISQTENRNLNFEGVNVYMKKVGNGRSLTFKFYTKDSTIINPNSFDETKWDQLVHGFNMVKNDSLVKYDVAFPIPLAKVPTIYTGGRGSGGDEARVLFEFSRRQGKIQQKGSIGYNFRIFEEGDWEIVFHFKRENPKFEDD